MKFVLFVEGYTERHRALRMFLKCWLDAHLSERVGIDPVRFNGCNELIDDLPRKAKMYLHSPSSREIIAVIALLDLYGPQNFYPSGLSSAEERLHWAVQELEGRVGEERFRMFFAVHEVEAWFLSEPSLFPQPIREAFPDRVKRPESVDFDEPPSKLLERLYWTKQRRHYKKVTHGSELFSKLSPDDVYEKCPHFKKMMEEMLQLAKAAGL